MYTVYIEILLRFSSTNFHFIYTHIVSIMLFGLWLFHYTLHMYRNIYNRIQMPRLPAHTITPTLSHLTSSLLVRFFIGEAWIILKFQTIYK